MSQIPVSVVILNWNSADALERCLGLLAIQSSRTFEIIIIDNASAGDALDGIRSRHPDLDITIKSLETNVGFAAANNIGARMANGKWLALLNADAFPEPEWLERLLIAAEKNPKYAFFSSRQVQANAPEFLDGAGDAYHISGLAWRHGYNHPSAQYGHEQKEIFSACAAAALIARDEFLAMGGFDEDYFSYFEDVDLGFRLQLAGRKCLYVPDAVVHHVGSASTGTRSDFSVYHGYRNMIWTFSKDMPSPLIWFFLPLHIGALMFFVFYLTLRGQGNVILRAIFDSLRGLSNVRAKRTAIQRSMKIKPTRLLEVMSVGLFEPYVEFLRRRRAR